MIDDRYRVVVVVGPARSGVTTTSLALGRAVAQQGRRVGVLMVDPVPSLETAAADVTAAGPWSERLDVAATFEVLVRSVAADHATAADLLANPLYATLTSSLPGASDFTLLERMTQLRDEDRFDVVIVDTPPSLPAGEFLTASARVKGFLGHPVYRALSVGQRTLGRVADAALSSFLGEVKSVAGHHVADATTAFFRRLSDLEGGLRRRLDEVTATLSADTTGFLAVTTRRPESVAECAPLVDRLAAVGSVAGVVVNRVPAGRPVGDRLRAIADGRSTVTLPDLGVGPVDVAFLDALADGLASGPGGPPVAGTRERTGRDG